MQTTPRQIDGTSNQNPAARLLLFLISADVILILADGLWGLAAIQEILPGRPYLLQVHQDFGIAEFFNFFKWMLAAYFLVTVLPEARRPVWTPAAVAMVLMFSDDSMMLHERVGKIVATWNIDAFGELGFIAGELGFVALLSLAVFGLLLLSRYRAPKTEKPFATNLILMMILLGVFGVGVDQLHSILNMIYNSYMLHSIMALLENGAEMIVTSMIAVRAFRINALTTTSGRAAPV